MKKVMYGTLAFFIAILILVIIVALQQPVKMVKYENGVVVDATE